MLTKHKLRELIDVTRGMSLPGEFYSETGELVRLTMGNFNYNGGGFKENTSKNDIYYTGPVRNEFILKKGDIITPLTEQAIGLLGTTAMIPESGKYIQSQDVALITCKDDKIDHLFCYYLVSSDIVKKQLSAAAQQTKIRHTSPDKIMDCTVWIPEMSEQKRIGKTLYDIDQKIALNTRINAELEAMAKQLYDYWFVQFDFPDENGKPYKSSGGKMVYNEKLKREIPEGWEVLNIFDAANVLYGYPFNTDFFSENETGKPVVRIRDIINNSTSAYTTEIIDDIYKIQEGDLVIGMDGNFHMNYWHNNVCYLNQRCVRFRDIKDKPISTMQLYYDIKPVIESKQKRIQGSTVGHLLDSDIKEFQILYPNKNKLEIKSLFDNILFKMTGCKKEIINLTHLRDSLLPMLMNGQVTVEE